MNINTLTPPKISITENEFRKDLLSLAEKIKSKDLTEDNTLIVGIARGGLIAAQYLAYALNLRDITTIQSKLYIDDIKKTEIHEIIGAFFIDFENYENIIVIDDIYDTGYTLDNVISMLWQLAATFLGNTENFVNLKIIPAVVYTQKKKKIMQEKEILFGKKIKKIDNKQPWLIFPWDTLSMELNNQDNS